MTGRGVSQDIAQSVLWCEHCADGGSNEAVAMFPMLENSLQ
jgi:hypothetical protein